MQFEVHATRSRTLFKADEDQFMFGKWKLVDKLYSITLSLTEQFNYNFVFFAQNIFIVYTTVTCHWRHYSRYS